MPAFGQGRLARVKKKPAKENLTSKQEILAWFWQTKGGLDVMTCMR